jgi:HSP20 family protein
MTDKPIPVTTSVSPKAPAPAGRRREWPTLTDLRREMDSLFEDFGRDVLSVPSRLSRMEPFSRFDLTPAVDIVEVEGAYKLSIELPGMAEKDIDVNVDGDLLTIRGEKSETREQDEKGRHVSERRYGAFERAFTLPAGVDRDHISAAAAAGVLTVTLPKSADAKSSARKIDVSTAGA